MRVLVTRPEEDAATLLGALAARGIEAISTPLLTIAYVDAPPLDLAGVQALLLTSANGARAFVRNNSARDIKVLAVGDATARTARELGFSDISSAGGDVDDLAGMAVQLLNPADGALLHPAGSKVAGDLAGLLAEKGFSYRREAMYSARTETELPAAARDGLAVGEIDGVLIYSPRTGDTFKRLVEAGELASSLRRVRAFCLSANVANAVADLPWAEILTAAQPEQTALLALFDET
ncbi:MAG: uroporphyrinogen-III synthase [Rhodospirillaceae bacterium]|nr:uroporphyrinogen-III synthase [Rhodospirillaceae bacterium]